MLKKVLIGLVLAAGVFGAASLAVSAGEKARAKDDLFRQVQLFADTLTIIREEYVDDTKAKDLIYGALKGTLSSLDPHSQFMDPDTYNELKVDTEGKFGGLGIEITIKDGLITVITPIEDTPAWKAGLKPNDKIVKINNELTRDMSLSDAVKKMRGKPGEAVNITVLRESEKKLLDFRIVRDIIRVKDIKEARILEEGIGYIRLVEFRENTPHDFNMALSRLTKSNMSALILDLRNNPGGLLDVAVKVTEKFIEKGKLIVYTKGRKPSQDYKFFSRANHPILNVPVVILINEGSASGSEIVAACLKDYHRALIMGVKSFGKGSVQTVIPLGDGSALRLTTSKYYSPQGYEIHGKGVMPDIVVEEAKIVPEANKLADGGATELFEQLENKDKEIKAEKDADYKSDNQIMRAIDALKAARFYNQERKEVQQK